MQRKHELELSPLSLMIMQCIRRFGVATTRQVCEELEKRQKRTYAKGSVFTTTTRLNARGLVDFVTLPPRPIAGGRARCGFRVSPLGIRAMMQAEHEVLV